MKFHDFANLFPLISNAEMEELAADIEQNGVLEPVTLMDGTILDGRNRWRAAQLAGAECPTVEYQGNDPLAFVISRNLKRRHLTESQRAMIANKIAQLRHGVRPDAQICASGMTQTDASEVMNVSRRSVQAARKIHDNASPQIVKAVEEGHVSVAAAAEVATLDHAEQDELAQAGAKAIKAKASEMRKARSAQVLDSLPDNVKEQREQALAARDKAEKNKRDWVAVEEEIAELRETLLERDAELVMLRDENAQLTRALGKTEADMVEEIRVLKARVASESADKAAQARSAKFWRKQAIDLGYSSDVVVPLGAPA